MDVVDVSMGVYILVAFCPTDLELCIKLKENYKTHLNIYRRSPSNNNPASVLR